MSVIDRHSVTGCYAGVQRQPQNNRPARAAADRQEDSETAISAVASRQTDSISLSMVLATAKGGAPEDGLPYKERWYPGLKFDGWA